MHRPSLTSALRFLAQLCIFSVRFAHSCRPINCPGCGTGGTSSSDDRGGNDDNTANTVLNIVRYLPGNFQALSDAFILPFLNEQLGKSFGGNFRAASFPANGKGLTTCPQDLDCDHFDQNCRWRNVQQEELTFYQGLGEPDTARWEFFMGTKQAPNEPFVLLASNAGNFQGWLVSDPVPSQPGDGYLEFRFWMTPLVEMKVCTRTPNTDDFLYCSPVIQSFQLPGPITVTIPGPVKQSFEIVIVISHFVTEPGGIVAIDNIAYRSSLCRENEIGNNIRTSTPTASRNKDFLNGRVNGRLASEQTPTSPSGRKSSGNNAVDVCSAVPCDFTAGACGYRLRSGEPNTEAFVLHRGRIGNPLTGIVRDRFGRTDFNEPFLLAQGSDPSGETAVIAETQPFTMTQTQHIRFYRHQASTSSKLKICVDSTSNCVRTFDDVARRWQAETVDIPPTGSTGRLLFVVEGLTPTGYLGIDDVEVVDAQGVRSIC